MNYVNYRWLQTFPPSCVNWDTLDEHLRPSCTRKEHMHAPPIPKQMSCVLHPLPHGLSRHVTKKTLYLHPPPLYSVQLSYIHEATSGPPQTEALTWLLPKHVVAFCMLVVVKQVVVTNCWSTAITRACDYTS